MILPADTLQPDTAVLSALRESREYDYSRELSNNIYDTLGQWVWHQVSQLLDSFFKALASSGGQATLVVLALVALAGVAAYILLRRRGLFKRKKDIAGDVADNEDNIYGVDFDKEITVARQRGDWCRVVRITYLKTLRMLADNKKIDWLSSKTPTQYSQEFASREFKSMTREFLRVRYGGFKADKQTADNMASMAETVGKEVEDEA